MRTSLLLALTLGCAGGPTTDADDTDVVDTDADDTEVVETDDTDLPVGVEVVDGVTQWADGTAAASCRAYRDGGDGYVGVGTGEELTGAYRIDPDGAGGEAPFTALCEMEADGGGWTLVMQTNPADRTDSCVTGAFGTLEAGTDVSASAKLSDTAINGVLAAGEGLEVRVASHDDSSATTRDAWTRTCTFDLVDTNVWATTTDATMTIEGTSGLCSDGSWTDPFTLDDAELCGLRTLVDFTPTGQDVRTGYFITTANANLSGGCYLGSGGRGWAGSSANFGCNVVKTWVR